jgi:hypothetical protein
VSFLVPALLATCAVGCAEAPPPAAAPAVVEAPIERKHGGPSVESEIGALNELKVQQTFQRSSEKLSACYSKGSARLPYLSGDVRFVVRVAKDGSARWAYVKDSSLGDRDTESCMLAVLKEAAWPHPEGGEGLAENSFTFEPGGDERAPVAWKPEQLGSSYKNARGALAQCRKKAGTKGLKATLYVETDGKPAAIGVSSADERGEAAVECVVGALHGLKFNSPGSYASKVSVTIE